MLAETEVRILTAENMERLHQPDEENDIQALLDDIVDQHEMLRDRTQLPGGEGLLLAMYTRRIIEGPEVVTRLVKYATRVLSGRIVERRDLPPADLHAVLIASTSAVAQLYDYYAADPEHLYGPAIQEEMSRVPQRSQQYGLSPEMAPRVVDRFTRLTTPPHHQ